MMATESMLSKRLFMAGLLDYNQDRSSQKTSLFAKVRKKHFISGLILARNYGWLSD